MVQGVIGWSLTCIDHPYTVISQRTTSWGRGGKMAQLVVGDPEDGGTNHIMAITFRCAAINFPAVYNFQHHQRPVPLTHTRSIWEIKDSLSL